MKFIKPLIAVLMILCMMMAFAACGPDDESNQPTTAAATSIADDTASNEESSAANTAVVTTKAVVRTTKKSDAGYTHNNKIKASKVDNLIKRTKNAQGKATDAFVKSLKGFELKIFYPWTPESKGAVKELKQSALDSMKAVEKEFGCKIVEDGKFDNYNDTLTANLTAGKADFNVYQVQDFNYASYFQRGYMTDLTRAMSESAVDFKDPWYVKSANSFFNVNYKQYAWIAFDAEYVFPYNVIIYNKNLFKKAKLTEPAVLAKKGQWTWDTLIKYSKKLTTSSVIGLGCVNATNVLNQMLVQNNASLVNVKKGQEPKENLSNQTVKNCMATLYTWCKGDKIMNTFSNQDWTFAKTQMAAGKVAMLAGGHDAIQTLRTNKKTTDEFAIAQFPTPKASKKFVNAAGPQFACFIPTAHKKNADKILFLRNELYRQNYKYAQRNFTYQWDTYFSDPEVLDYCCNIKYARGNNDTVFTWNDVCLKSDSKGTFSGVLRYTLDNNGDVAGGITKYQTAIQKSFKEVWGGYKITGNV